jgi:predicted HTH domain antitoxin
MSQIVFDIPNDVLLALKMSEGEAEETLRMVAAVKLYELGRLTSGQAARLAGTSRVVFLLQAKKHGVPSVAWDKEELAAEALPIAP